MKNYLSSVRAGRLFQKENAGGGQAAGGGARGGGDAAGLPHFFQLSALVSFISL